MYVHISYTPIYTHMCGCIHMYIIVDTNLYVTLYVNPRKGSSICILEYPKSARRMSTLPKKPCDLPRSVM